jgi:hypothetical protein
MDADRQHQPNDIKKLIQYIGEYDMVVGARTKESKISLLRRTWEKDFQHNWKLFSRYGNT